MPATAREVALVSKSMVARGGENHLRRQIEWSVIFSRPEKDTSMPTTASAKGDSLW